MTVSASGSNIAPVLSFSLARNFGGVLFASLLLLLFLYKHLTSSIPINSKYSDIFDLH